MPEGDSRLRELLAGLDRFLQWDLVTVTPWGAPSISPVGARLLPDEATIWTSTTVGYATKLRNIEGHPRVALLRAHPEEAPVLLRGEARIVGGDGTANLAQLFRLMGGAGGARRFFATSATNPFWSRLYRAYWRRVLVAVRIVEISTMGEVGWQPVRLGDWSKPRAVGAGPRLRRVRRTANRLLETSGRAMLDAGTPVILATVRRPGSSPWAWPVAAKPEPGGAIRVDAGFALPAGRLGHSSLATRVIDDSFEVARLVGWIGTLEPGDGPRLMRPRASYGFAKPPGMVGDLAAGLAALLREVTASGPSPVSSPDLERALESGGTRSAPPLQLPEKAWRLLAQLFARRNAASPWYAAEAQLVFDRRLSDRLSRLAQRAQLERDWAQGLLARGSRRVGVVRLTAAAVAFRPNPARPGATASREEAQIKALLGSLRGQLPEGLDPPTGDALRAGSEPLPIGASDPQQGLAEAALAAAGSMAAALDRLAVRHL